jgi:hypothetical protein
LELLQKSEHQAESLVVGTKITASGLSILAFFNAIMGSMFKPTKCFHSYPALMGVWGAYLSGLKGNPGTLKMAATHLAASTSK